MTTRYEAAVSETGLEGCMEKLNERLDTAIRIALLLPDCVRTIENFYRDGFGYTSRKSEVSIVSHARCIEAILRLPTESTRSILTNQRLAQLIQVFELNPWTSRNNRGKSAKDNAYAASVAIPAAIALLVRSGSPSRVIAAKVRSGLRRIGTLISEVAKQEAPGRVYSHGLFIYRMARALGVVDTNKALSLIAPSSCKSDKAVVRLLKRSRKLLNDYTRVSIHELVSLCHAVPDSRDSALNLGYFVVAAVLYGNFEEDVIIDHATSIALSALFTQAATMGPQTAYRDAVEHVSASPIELITLASDMASVRRKFADLESYFNAAYNMIIGTMRFPVGEVGKKAGPLWMAEPWRGRRTEEPWYNACVVEFLSAYRGFLEDICRDNLLVVFGASTSVPRLTFDRLVIDDANRKLISNFMAEAKDAFASGKKLRRSSVILFGPPGTSKTSIARAIAHSIGVPFIGLGPHDFALRGLENVIARASEVFGWMRVMRKCVVFLDEIDELVVERVKEEEKIGRLITGSLLPWFQGLHDSGRLVLIVATNHIDRFDAAIRRPGRFDLVLPVGPLDASARIRMFSEFLDEGGVARGVAWEAGEREALCVAAVREVSGCLIPEDDAGKGRRIPWPVTIGEVLGICDSLLEKRLKLSRSEVAAVVAAVVRDAGRKPLISGPEYVRFLVDSDKYKFPS